MYPLGASIADMVSILIGERCFPDAQPGDEVSIIMKSDTTHGRVDTYYVDNKPILSVHYQETIYIKTYNGNKED